MPKRSSKDDNREDDINLIAKRIVDESTEGDEYDDIVELLAQAERDGKNPAAVLLGHFGGLKGGKARAEKLSKEERSEIARKAAKARWEKKKKQRDS